MYDPDYSPPTPLVDDELLSLMAKDESLLPLLAELPRPSVILRPIDIATATRRNTPASPIALLLLRGASEVDGAVLFSISIQPLASSVMGMVVLILLLYMLECCCYIVVGVFMRRGGRASSSFMHSARCFESLTFR